MESCLKKIFVLPKNFVQFRKKKASSPTFGEEARHLTRRFCINPDVSFEQKKFLLPKNFLFCDFKISITLAVSLSASLSVSLTVSLTASLTVSPTAPS